MLRCHIFTLMKPKVFFNNSVKLIDEGSFALGTFLNIVKIDFGFFFADSSIFFH